MSGSSERLADLIDQISKSNDLFRVARDEFVGLQLPADPSIGGMDGRVGRPAEGGGNLGEARIGEFASKVGTEATGQNDSAMSPARKEFVSIHADLFADDFQDPREPDRLPAGGH